MAWRSTARPRRIAGGVHSGLAEFGPKGIRVQHFAPGPISIEGTESIAQGYLASLAPARRLGHGRAGDSRSHRSPGLAAARVHVVLPIDGGRSAVYPRARTRDGRPAVRARQSARDAYPGGPRAAAAWPVARSSQVQTRVEMPWPQIRGALRGQLHVGAIQTLAVIEPLALLATFRRAHPGVTIRLSHDAAPVLARAAAAVRRPAGHRLHRRSHRSRRDGDPHRDRPRRPDPRRPAGRPAGQTGQHRTCRSCVARA